MVLGLTGISGSGKHTAAEWFEKKNWIILNADQIAHYLYRPYTGVWKRVVDAFGEKILNKDDTINRQRLGKIVFDPADPKLAEENRQKLNKIIHPSVIRNIKDVIHRHFRRQSNIVVVASLWKELELEKICDKLLLLKAYPDVARQRITRRDSIGDDMYLQRISSQSEPPSPDFVIENNGTEDELFKALKALPLEG